MHACLANPLKALMPGPRPVNPTQSPPAQVHGLSRHEGEVPARREAHSGGCEALRSQFVGAHSAIDPRWVVAHPDDHATHAKGASLDHHLRPPECGWGGGGGGGGWGWGGGGGLRRGAWGQLGPLAGKPCPTKQGSRSGRQG